MRVLNISQTSDFLETANIETTVDCGHAIIHTGTTEAGSRFVLVNDCHGDSSLIESL